jgi:hypothetical protein
MSLQLRTRPELPAQKSFGKVISVCAALFDTKPALFDN